MTKNIVGGLLIPNIKNLEKRTMFGIGFGNQTPIDIIPIYLLSSIIPDLTLLLVDQFHLLNGEDPLIVNSNLERFVDDLTALEEIYNTTPNLMLSSKIMKINQYQTIFENIKNIINSEDKLKKKINSTIPLKRRETPNAQDYPLHELACVKYFEKKGIGLKLGPSKEKKYDRIMRQLGFNIEFGYILDSLAIGTLEIGKVVHYIPNSFGPKDGRRIYLSDTDNEIIDKISTSCKAAQQYLCKIACVAGNVIGQEHLEISQINKLNIEELRTHAQQLVIENIIAPYRGAK